MVINRFTNELYYSYEAGDARENHMTSESTWPYFSFAQCTGGEHTYRELNGYE
jgi:hypothetical protein